MMAINKKYNANRGKSKARRRRISQTIKGSSMFAELARIAAATKIADDQAKSK
jgi:hypothetical protein